MKKRNLKPVSIQEHLAEILRLANGEITTSAMLEKTAVLTNKENQN